MTKRLLCKLYMFMYRAFNRMLLQRRPAKRGDLHPFRRRALEASGTANSMASADSADSSVQGSSPPAANAHTSPRSVTHAVKCANISMLLFSAETLAERLLACRTHNGPVEILLCSESQIMLCCVYICLTEPFSWRYSLRCALLHCNPAHCPGRAPAGTSRARTGPTTRPPLRRGVAEEAVSAAARLRRRSGRGRSARRLVGRSAASRSTRPASASAQCSIGD